MVRMLQNHLDKGIPEYESGFGSFVFGYVDSRSFHSFSKCVSCGTDQDEGC